jgi:putative hydrolase of the HAD superfamily
MIAMSPIEPLSPPPMWLRAINPSTGTATGRSGRMPKSRGMIIDLDDTLYPRGRFVQSGFAAVSVHLATSSVVSAGRAYAHLSRCAARGEAATAFQSLCSTFNLNIDLVPVLVDVFRSHTPDIFLGHGARELLAGLRSDGWRLAVLTNGLPAVQRRKVEALGLSELVDHVIFAENLAPGGKPAPAVFREALLRLGTRAERSVAVGDDPTCDIAGARAVGVATIRLAVSAVTVPHDQEADVVVSSLTEVRQAATALMEGAIRHAA